MPSVCQSLYIIVCHVVCLKPSENFVSYHLKGVTSRYFELLFGSLKIVVNWKETFKYLFARVDKHQRGKNKAKGSKDG